MPTTTYQTADPPLIHYVGSSLSAPSDTSEDRFHNMEDESAGIQVSGNPIPPLGRQFLYGLPNNHSIFEIEDLTLAPSTQLRSRAVDRLYQDIVVLPPVPVSSSLAPMVQPISADGLLHVLSRSPSQFQVECTSLQKPSPDEPWPTTEFNIDRTFIVDQIIREISRTRFGALARRLDDLHRLSINDPGVDTINTVSLWSASRVLETTTWALPIAIGLADGGSIQMLWESDDTSVSVVVTFLPDRQARFAALDDSEEISGTVHYTLVEEELQRFICRI